MGSQPPPNDVNSQIIEHLAGFASKGMSLENATAALRALGWTDQEIGSALEQHPYSTPQPTAPNLSQSNYSATMPSFTVPTETSHVSKAAVISIVLSLLILGAFLVFTLFRYSSTPTSKTSGTITANDCLKENGLVTGLSSKTCQIGSVQLNIIDN